MILPKKALLKINQYLLILFLVTFNSCNTLDDKVQEYRGLNEKISEVYKEISAGTKDEKVGLSEIMDLKLELVAFEEEVIVQYTLEEKIRKEIEEQREKDRKIEQQAIEAARKDSIKQAKLEEQEQMREVAAMIAAEEEADWNAYVEELEENGLFLAYFDGEAYEINQKDWENWKQSENYDSEDALKYREMIRAMGPEKANGLANSMYRTLSNGIGREGITFKAVQGIQVYDVMTTGNIKFK